MRGLLILLNLSCVFFLSGKTIVDMAGRTVEVPDTIESILPYDSKTSILLFPLLKEKMIATALLPGKEAYKFISPEYALIPEVDVKNIEAVLSVHPELIMSGFYDPKDNKERAEKLGSRLSTPVVFIDLSIDKLDQTYEFLGQLFNKEQESKVFTVFLKALYHQMDSLKTSHSPIQAKVYYTLGPSGLLTDPSGSKHTEVFDFLNIPNAAEVDVPSGGHVKVNMEQVLIWNPDYIFTASFKGKSSAYARIVNDGKWEGIKAVQQERVFHVPSEPFAWFDHPPSINRIPGAIWLCQVFYGQAEAETRASIRDFYRLFYDYNLSSAAYDSLFN